MKQAREMGGTNLSTRMDFEYVVTRLLYKWCISMIAYCYNYLMHSGVEKLEVSVCNYSRTNSLSPQYRAFCTVFVGRFFLITFTKT